MLFQKTRIAPILAQKGRLSVFPSEQLLFSVENGRGRLRPVWYAGGISAALRGQTAGGR